MCAADPPAVAGWQPAAPPAIQAQQSASGLVIAEDVDGRVTVFDTAQRIVFEMDKDEGRPVRIGVPPGTYEVRLQARRPAVRITVQVRDGEYTIVDADRFAQPSTGQPQAAGVPVPAADRSPKGPRGDAINRIEVPFAVYPTPSFRSEETANDIHRREADMGLGLDYLRFVGRDIAIGVSATSLIRSDTVWTDRDHDNVADDDHERTRNTHSTTFVYGVVRWNFARRLTEWRTLEPYVTGGLGPVFRWNQKKVEIHDDDMVYSTEVITGLGGRLGAGFDIHLGPVFTLGAVGSWNWSTCEDETIGYGSKDRGGYAAVTMGFVWGRPKVGHKIGSSRLSAIGLGLGLTACLERPVAAYVGAGSFHVQPYFFHTGTPRPGVQGAPAASIAAPSARRSRSIRPRSFSSTAPNPSAAMS